MCLKLDATVSKTTVPTADWEGNMFSFLEPSQPPGQPPGLGGWTLKDEDGFGTEYREANARAQAHRPGPHSPLNP